MRALKAQWAVTAELIPGNTIAEYTKVWHYTSEDFEKDRQFTFSLGEHLGSDSGVPCTMPIFYGMQKAAMDYAASLQDPASLNVVKFTFMWM